MTAASSHYICRYPVSVNWQNVRVVFEFIFSVTHFFSSFSLSLSSFPMLAEIIILLFGLTVVSSKTGCLKSSEKKNFWPIGGRTIEKSGWCIRCQQIYTQAIWTLTCMQHMQGRAVLHHFFALFPLEVILDMIIHTIVKPSYIFIMTTYLPKYSTFFFCSEVF